MGRAGPVLGEHGLVAQGAPDAEQAQAGEEQREPAGLGQQVSRAAGSLPGGRSEDTAVGVDGDVDGPVTGGAGQSTARKKPSRRDRRSPGPWTNVAMTGSAAKAVARTRLTAGRSAVPAGRTVTAALPVGVGVWVTGAPGGSAGGARG